MAELAAIDIGSEKGLRFSIRVPGLQGFTIALSRFGSDMVDYTPFWEGKFKTWWYALRQLDYAAAGGTTGPQWAPLSENYLKWKNRHYPSATLLVRDNRLKPSITTATADGSIWRSSAKTLEVGSSIPYAIYHQTGTRRNAKPYMPARPVIRFAPADRVRLGKLLQAHVAALWRGRTAE